jgi:hypothetical protein
MSFAEGAGRPVAPVVVSALTGILTLGTSSVAPGAAALAGAGWLRVWVPRHDPTRAPR